MATAFPGVKDEIAGHLLIQTTLDQEIRYPLVVGNNLGYWLNPASAPKAMLAWRGRSRDRDVALFRIEVPITDAAGGTPLRSWQVVATTNSPASPFVLGVTLEL